MTALRLPGLIDVHVHGGDGFDTMDATPKALHRMAIPLRSIAAGELGR